MMNATLTDAPDEFAVKLISAASQLFPKRPGNVTLTMILNPVVWEGFVNGKSGFLRSIGKMDPTLAFGQQLPRTRNTTSIMDIGLEYSVSVPRRNFSCFCYIN